MQRPTQPTAVVFNSARQPVTQVHVALAQTFVTCDEQGDSFWKQQADLRLEVLYAGGGGGGRGGGGEEV